MAENNGTNSVILNLFVAVAVRFIRLFICLFDLVSFWLIEICKYEIHDEHSKGHQIQYSDTKRVCILYLDTYTL